MGAPPKPTVGRLILVERPDGPVPAVITAIVGKPNRINAAVLSSTDFGIEAGKKGQVGTWRWPEFVLVEGAKADVAPHGHKQGKLDE